MSISTRLVARITRIRPSPTVSITAQAGALRAEGRDVIALSAGEPDFQTPSHIGEAALEAIRSGQTKYTAVAGSQILKEAIVAKFQRDNGLDFHSNQVLISSGGKQSLYNACQVLLEEGDEAIVPAPYCCLLYTSPSPRDS